MKKLILLVVFLFIGACTLHGCAWLQNQADSTADIAVNFHKAPPKTKFIIFVDAYRVFFEQMEQARPDLMGPSELQIYQLKKISMKKIWSVLGAYGEYAETGDFSVINPYGFINSTQARDFLFVNLLQYMEGK